MFSFQPDSNWGEKKERSPSPSSSSKTSDPFYAIKLNTNKFPSRLLPSLFICHRAEHSIQFSTHSLASCFHKTFVTQPNGAKRDWMFKLFRNGTNSTFFLWFAAASFVFCFHRCSIQFPSTSYKFRYYFPLPPVASIFKLEIAKRNCICDHE